MEKIKNFTSWGRGRGGGAAGGKTRLPKTHRHTHFSTCEIYVQS